jgi:hypothetical protein
MAAWDPDGAGPLPPLLVAGGAFSHIGRAHAEGIAAWDGSAWHPLGAAPSLSFLDVVDGGLYASASFDGVDFLRRWNGNTWIALGGSGPTTALVSFNGSLTAGGFGFRTSDGSDIHGAFSWDGTAWRELSGLSGDPSHQFPQVTGLAVLNGLLYACGNFSVGGEPFCLARWDGAAWFGVSSAPNLSSIRVFGDDLLVAGQFSVIGGVAAHNIARWDGTAFHPLGDGVVGGPYGSARIVAGVDGGVVVGGSFQTAGGAVANNIAVWDGRSWAAFGIGLDPGASCGAVFNGSLFVGGDFTGSGDQILSRLARWDGGSWQPIGTGMNDVPQALTVCDPDAAGPALQALYAGGLFREAGGARVDGIGGWNGTNWASLGWGTDGNVYAFTLWDPDGGGPLSAQLVAGGGFAHTGSDSTGQIETGRVARWDGTAWHAIGQGLGQQADARVNALTTLDGDLVAAGYIDVDGSGEQNRVARWDGAAWQSMGNPFDANIDALAVFQGQLYAAGAFTSTFFGPPVSRIARWNGSGWTNVGGGVDAAGAPWIYALAVYRGELVVAGHFAFAGAANANNIAAWNGTSWRALGLGVTNDDTAIPSILALCTHEGNLIASGRFAYADQQQVDNLARWDGLAWTNLGWGTNDTVRCLASFGGELIVGGDFTAVGDDTNGEQVSVHWARWRDMGCCGSADFNGDGAAGTDADIDAFFACLSGNCCPTCGSADFNGDGAVATDADIEAFFRVLAGGSC